MNVGGGIKLSEVSIELPLALALWSAYRNVALPPRLVSFGELSLAGEVRPVGFSEKRVKAAIEMGFDRLMFASIRKPRCSLNTFFMSVFDQSFCSVLLLYLPSSSSRQMRSGCSFSIVWRTSSTLSLETWAVPTNVIFLPLPKVNLRVVAPIFSSIITPMIRNFRSIDKNQSHFPQYIIQACLFQSACTDTTKAFSLIILIYRLLIAPEATYTDKSCSILFSSGVSENCTIS